MPYSKRFSTASMASLFVVLVCLAIVVLDGWRTWQAHALKMREASVSVSNMARALTQHADDTFRQADTVLINLQERLHIDGVTPPSLQRLHRLMMVQVRTLPQFAGIFFYDRTGRWVVNSTTMAESHFNNADRDYFIYHRDHPGTEPYIGAPVKSRSSGRWIMTISRRVDNVSGGFEGVLLVTIDVDYFQHYYDSFDIGRSGAILLALNDGTVVMRRPGKEQAFGKRMAEASILRDYASKKSSGIAEIRSSQDGVLRLNAYRHLQSYPLFVSVALAHDDVLQEWRTDAYVHMLWVMLLVTGFALMGARMVEQIRQRAKAEGDAVRARAQVEELNCTLAQLAMQDGLTGLANRRRFDAVLQHELQRASRSGETLSLIMLDVDQFKMYNDMYGHLSGDQCLRQIAQAIVAAVQRSGDLAARYGGEEFAMILPACNEEQAVAIAERIRLAVREKLITHLANPGGIVTVSLGVACLSEEDRNATANGLVAAADQALYRAKSNGRDQVGR